MTKILAATMLAVLAFTATPASAGCTDDLTAAEGEPLVERHPDGSMTIHPPRGLFAAVGTFVNCVV